MRCCIIDVDLSTRYAGPRFEGDPTLRPGIVHRLDKDTSGVLVVAKDDVTHARLSEQFMNLSGDSMGSANTRRGDDRGSYRA